ncbi:hypothetical protein MKW98_014202 [Papaver atlanticum]|uniref:HTH OST-type domain-containing protein n=1 Tax=Papaver atlanticum TaxID=357466 RepID=A0AAD4SLT0_9MAGN|nr:hypothetical protein MKW98_014202 [Papaver atlanticum]
MGFSSQAYINQQTLTSPQGPVTIFWDIENCQVPSDVCPEDVAGNIRMALRVHPNFQDAAVASFSAYGDFNAFTKRLREGCQRTGVKLVDVPNGRKDAADKAILVDMFLFALDNPPPSTILLISGDVDFSPALHILGQRGYTVILVIPAGVAVSSALTKAGRFVWDWPSMARGEGSVPPKTLMSLGASQINGNLQNDSQSDEEAIVCKGMTHEVPAMPANEEESTMWIQPGDIIGLKGQLVKLLELSGGLLPLCRVPGEYNKKFGRPLCIADYGANKLVNLLDKMADTMTVEGEGEKRYVHLCKSNDRHKRVESSNKSTVSPKQKWRVKERQEETVDINVCNIPECSSEELSDDDKGSVVGLTSKSTDDHLNKMSDTMTLEAEGEKKYAYLGNANDRHENVEDSNQSAVFPEKDERGKGCEEDTVDTTICTTQNDEEAKSCSRNLQSGLNDVPAMPANEGELKTCVQHQPGDITSLKGQLVRLLNLSGGCVPLIRVAEDYNKIFGRPLCKAEYGVEKLVDLLKKMSDSMTVEGEGVKMYVYLRKEELTTLVQRPGDIISLKGQLVKLLELSGGCLPLTRVAVDYNRTFGHPLCKAEYGVHKLVDLLKMIADTMTVKGEGKTRQVHLCNAIDRHQKVENSNQSAVSPKIEERGKGCTIPGCSSDEFSDDDDKRVMVGPTSKSNDSLKQFKQEILELLVSCSCKIHLDSLEELYQQRYKKDLYHQSFGVNNLEELIDTLWDDVNFYEEQESKRKFVVPNFAKLRFQTF